MRCEFQCVGIMRCENQSYGVGVPVYNIVGDISHDGYYYLPDVDADGDVEGFRECPIPSRLFCPINEKFPPIELGDAAHKVIVVEDYDGIYHVAIDSKWHQVGKKLVSFARKYDFAADFYMWFERYIYQFFYEKIDMNVIREFYSELNYKYYGKYWNASCISMDNINRFWEMTLLRMYRNPWSKNVAFLYKHVEGRDIIQTLAIIDDHMILHMHHVIVNDDCDVLAVLNSEFFTCGDAYDDWRSFLVKKFDLTIS